MDGRRREAPSVVVSGDPKPKVGEPRCEVVIHCGPASRGGSRRRRHTEGGTVMKRFVLVAAAALAAVAAIGAGGAGSAYGLSATADSWSAASAAGSQEFQCTSDGVAVADADPGPNQVCVITGSTGTCIQMSDSPVVLQKCTFTQAIGDATKRAKVIQVAAANKGPSTQKHTQRVEVMQDSTAASNFVDVSQTVKQSLGPGHYDDTEEAESESVSSTSSAPIISQQDFHQVVVVVQDTATGNNTSSISQFGKQRARAKQALSISQNQNTLPAATPDEECPADDVNANMCSRVTQTSVTGQNLSTLKDAYSQFERAHKTTTGDQKQGIPGTGGLDHEINQTSSGFCKIVTSQSERQTMRSVQANVLQNQHGPTRKGVGSSQTCSTNSVWTGNQDSSQLATSRPKEEDIDSLVFAAPANQTNFMEYFADSTGSIHATQSASQRNNAGSETEQNSCPGIGGTAQFCFAVITCAEGSCSASDGGELE